MFSGYIFVLFHLPFSAISTICAHSSLEHIGTVVVIENVRIRICYSDLRIDSYLHTWVWYTVKIVGTRNVRKKTIISGSQALLNLALFGTTKKYIFFWFLFQNPNAEALGLFSQSHHLFYWNKSLQQRIYQHTHIIDQEKETHTSLPSARRCQLNKMCFGK